MNLSEAIEILEALACGHDPISVKTLDGKWVETDPESLEEFYYQGEEAQYISVKYHGEGAKGKGKFRLITGTLSGMVKDRIRHARKRNKPFNLKAFLMKLTKEQILLLMSDALGLMRTKAMHCKKKKIIDKNVVVMELLGCEFLDGKWTRPTLKTAKQLLHIRQVNRELQER
jgi:hypothetical protein